MPDDERSRRRLGDATKSRIADLAAGWTVPTPDDPNEGPDDLPELDLPDDPPPPPASVEPPPATAAAHRSKPKTVPPPPPGSPARGPISGPTETGTVARSGVIEIADPPPRAKPRTSPPPPPLPGAVKVSDSPQLASPPKPAAVPIGEFGSARGPQTRAPETVVQPQPVELLLSETAHHLMRGDATTVDAPETTRFERGDPTSGGAPDATLATVPPNFTSKLRAAAALRRKRGIGGDLKYVVTALLGVRGARRELAALERQHVLRTTERRNYMVTLGRAAAGHTNLDHPALGPARERFATIEDERSRHAGAVAAADAELIRVKRDRDAKAKQTIDDIAALDREVSELAIKLEPLEKERAAIAKEADRLRHELRDLDAKIKATEATQHSPKLAADQVAQVRAMLATLRANRQATQQDEPRIASKLEALEPRIAAVEARRSQAGTQRAELERAEQADQRRTEELLTAIGAKRRVVERATADAEALRDQTLLELGERLYVDRPPVLQFELAPIDAIDLDLGTNERRTMELREILSSVDRAKLTRGVLWMVLLVAIGLLIVIGLWKLVH